MNKTVNEPVEDYIPVIIIVVGTMNGKHCKRHYSALLDSGSTTTWISRRAATAMNVPLRSVERLSSITMCGKLESSHAITCDQSLLPDFSTSKRLDQFTARLFDKPLRYDMIIGRDVLSQIGVVMDYQNKQLIWDKDVVPMTTQSELNSLARRPDQVREAMFHKIVLKQLDIEDENDANASNMEIKAANYSKVDIADVVNKQTHLSAEQREQLQELLSQFPNLFSGKLGRWPGGTIHLDIQEGATPVHKRHYPVPRIHEKTFKDELDRLVAIGVLERVGRSEWAAPTFIIPKKDGTVRFVSDFRALNKVIKRKVYPLPRIQDILARRKGYKFFTKLDISMQYYTFELDDKSKDLLTIATPFGLYRYKRLAMGVNQAPDISQEVMDKVLQDIDDVEKYLDDVGCFSDDWTKHLALLETVLQRLEDNGFTINPSKCEWAVKETDWLGYWLTPVGIKPWQKKVQALLDMQPPTNITQLRSFIGLATYYRTMWPHRAHTLAPLTDMTGTKKFKWKEEHQRAFEEMKALAASDALLHYPDHNKPFDIETDASDYQLGAVIKQEGAPVAYYSRKLNTAQRNYTTIEKELLSIVETLKEFRSMLLGAQLRVFTDHKNLTHQLTQFQTQRVLRWRLYIEEYGPQFFYRKGIQNPVADAFSRVPTARMSPSAGEALGKEEVRSGDNTSDDEEVYSLIDEPQLADCLMHHPAWTTIHKTSGLDGASGLACGSGLHAQYGTGLAAREQQETQERHKHARHEKHSAPNVDQQDESYLIHPAFEEGQYPLSYDVIAAHQREEAGLMRAVEDDHRKEIQYKQLGDAQVIILQTPDPAQWKICIPSALLDKLIDWYHLSLAHAGITNMEATISRHFTHPKLGARIRERVGACDICQRMKTGSKAYGKLPARDVRIAPWYEVHVDLIGPWKITVGNVEISFKALTMIDPVTNLLEIVPYRSKSAHHISRLFENTWLSRYPRPMRVVFDRGAEFKGPFMNMLRSNGIEAHPTSTKNPTANAICERVHLTIGNVLRTLMHTRNPNRPTDVDEIIEQALATAMHATRVAAHNSLNKWSPGALVFQRDMLLDIPLIADIMAITTQRELKINNSLLKANAQRLTYDYHVGEQVLLKVPDPAKMDERWEGPYRIEQVHVNGTVTIRLSPMITERLNIRRIKPYRQLHS